MAYTYDSAALTYDSASVTYDGWGPGTYNAPGVTYNQLHYAYNAFSDQRTQFTVADLCVELFLKSPPIWALATTSVRIDAGIRLGRGRSSEDGEASPAWADLTFDNAAGKYSPRNTASTIYGRIGRNTPVRIGFGSPVVGEVRTGSGSTVNIDQIDRSLFYDNVGVMAVGVVLPTDTLSTPVGYANATEIDAAAFTVKRAFTTDNAVVSASTFTASGSPTAWVTAQCAVPGGTYVSSDGGTADAGADPAGAALTSITEGDLLVAMVAWTSDPLGRMNAPYFTDGVVPAEIYQVADSGPSSGPRIAIWAWQHRTGHAAVRFAGAQDDATGATMQISRWTGALKYTPRFTGEIADWPVEWSKNENDIVTRVRAGGVLRRMAQSTDAVSALRAALAFHADITHYWPMEDTEGSASYAPAVGTSPMVGINGMNPAVVEEVAGSLALPDFTARGARGFVTPVNSAPWGFGGVISIPANGTAPGTNLLVGECGTSGDINAFGIEYTDSTTLTIKARFNDGTPDATGALDASYIGTAFPTGINGKQIFAYITMAQSGADVPYSIYLTNITPTDALATFSLVNLPIPTRTLGALAAVTACTEAGSSATIGTNSVSVGHVFTTEGSVLGFADYRRQAARGYAGSVLTEVARVVARDSGFLLGLVYPATDVLRSGVLEPDTTLAQLRDAAQAGQAFLQDAAGYPGLEWRPITAVTSQSPVFTFVYDGDTFAEGLAPTDDDKITLNDATVTSTTGGQGRVVVETGTFGAQPGGIGRYAQTFTLPVKGADAAKDLAGWLTCAGTFDAARWPELSLRMSGAGNQTLDMAALSIGDTVRVSNLPAFTGPSSVDLVIVGFAEDIDSAKWTCTLITRPAGPYRVLVWDSATFGTWADSANPNPLTDLHWSM